MKRAALVDDARARQFLRRKEVLARYNVSNPTLYRWIRAGLFPRPVKLVKGGAASGWRLSALEAHDATNDARLLAERLKIETKKKAAHSRRPRA